LPAPEDTTAQQQVQQHMRSKLFWYWPNIMSSILGRARATVKHCFWDRCRLLAIRCNIHNFNLNRGRTRPDVASGATCARDTNDIHLITLQSHSVRAQDLRVSLVRDPR